MKRQVFKIGIAPDSFKGSLTAMEAATCIERGLRRVLAGISVTKIPMADGGDGTAQAIVEATGGKLITRTVHDPVGRKIRSAFGLTGDGKVAVVEMASASGLALLKPAERNPMKTSTSGTGELMMHALRLGAKKILVGIGGSATNDGGTGMASALGVKFLDQRGRRLSGIGRSLRKIRHIDMSCLDRRIRDVYVEVACDVDNPLAGPRGAAHVYGPQKGATPAMVRELEAGLKHFAGIIRRDVGVDIRRIPGSGAAGGLGAGLMAFVGGELRPGVDIVTDVVELERRLKGCDIAITGEGRMDGQTVFGKTPAGVAKVAKRLGIPVIAICGSLGKDVNKVHSVGIDAYFCALEEPMDEGEIRTRGAEMLRSCAGQVGRLMALNTSGLKLKSGR